MKKLPPMCVRLTTIFLIDQNILSFFSCQLHCFGSRGLTTGRIQGCSLNSWRDARFFQILKIFMAWRAHFFEWPLNQGTHGCSVYEDMRAVRTLAKIRVVCAVIYAFSILTVSHHHRSFLVIDGTHPEDRKAFPSALRAPQEFRNQSFARFLLLFFL